MDLDTLFTTVYVLVDDWYKQHGQPARRSMGRPCQMSDSAVLTLGMVGQWRVGVPWRSERGMVRYMQAQGRHWFPTLLQRSGFNYSFRQLWAVFVRLQQAFAHWLSTPQTLYECVDSLPLPAYSLAQGRKHRQRHWLWQATLGYSKAGWFWGHRWLVSVLACGAITGWVVGAAHIQDRWLLQALLSGRALGYLHLRIPDPLRYVKPKRRPSIPVSKIGPSVATGEWTSRSYLADPAFNGKAWRQQWRRDYRAQVISVPPRDAPDARHWTARDRHWLAQHRQLIETVFATLSDVFAVKQLGGHSDWGQSARLAAIGAAFHLGIWLNRLRGDPTWRWLPLSVDFSDNALCVCPSRPYKHQFANNVVANLPLRQSVHSVEAKARTMPSNPR